MADNLAALYGDYASEVLKQFAQTPRQGLAPLADNVTYASGCVGDHSTVCQVRADNVTYASGCVGDHSTVCQVRIEKVTYT